MHKPMVVIVGRPNVGKSTLFNRLVGGRGALVENRPGITRDRHYGDADVLGRALLVIDTGGFEPSATEGMLSAMRAQAEIAIDEADAVIVLHDGHEGVLPADQEIVRLMARSSKPVFHAVNKIDGQRHERLVPEFWEMGVESLYPISAQHGPGVLDLMEDVLSSLPEEEDAEDAEPGRAGAIRVAVIGKPNVGKSTLVNRLLGEDRLLVSDVPGTTRDAIDTWHERPPDPALLARAESDLAALIEADEPVPVDDDDDVPSGVFDMEDRAWSAQGDPEALERAISDARDAVEAAREPRRYLFIDTAGIRRRKWVKTHIERASIIQAFKAIDRAEICLLLIDATQGVTDQDAKLAGLIQDKGRACVILVNKWDAVEGKTTDTAGAFIKDLHHNLQFVRHAPVVLISALSGQRVHRILGAVDHVNANNHRRVPTGALNRFVAGVVRRKQPPLHKNRRLRIYYCSQVAVAPPTFILSVNDPHAIHFSYKRYILNQLRDAWDFGGAPLRLILRKHNKRRA